MPEIGTSGSMSGDENRRDAIRPQRPRSSSTLPLRRIRMGRKLSLLEDKPTCYGHGRSVDFDPKAEIGCPFKCASLSCELS
jgi:hypothetical protein